MLQQMRQCHGAGLSVDLANISKELGIAEESALDIFTSYMASLCEHKAKTSLDEIDTAFRSASLGLGAEMLSALLSNMRFEPPICPECGAKMPWCWLVSAQRWQEVKNAC